MAKNGTTDQQERAQKMWDDMTGQAEDIVVLLFGLLITPLIICVGAAYGIRAGIVAGTEKTLELLKSWKA